MIPPGYRLALNLRGKDYENGFPDARQPGGLYTLKGVGPFNHSEPKDRPSSVFGGRNRFHFEAGKESCLLLPIIPNSPRAMSPAPPAR